MNETRDIEGACDVPFLITLQRYGFFLALPNISVENFAQKYGFNFSRSVSE